MKRFYFLMLLALVGFAGVWADVPFETATLDEDGTFPYDTRWYTIKQGATGYVWSDNDGGDYISLEATETEYASADLWCFVEAGDDSYYIFNQQAGAGKVLAAPIEMLGTTGSGSYPILVDLDDIPDGYIAQWVFEASDDLGDTEAYYCWELGYEDNKVNYRDGALAFWNGGADAGSCLVIEFGETQVLISPSTGTLTSTSSSSSYYRWWTSTATDPQLVLDAGYNNMCILSDYLAVYRGSNVSEQDYTLSATDYTIAGYTFRFLDYGSNYNTFTIGDEAYEAGDEWQTITVTGLNESAAVAFTVTGNNVPFLVDSFYVTIHPSQAEPLPSGYYYIVNANDDWYYTSTDEDDYGTIYYVDKAMYDDAEGYVMWGTLDTLDLQYMWLITDLDGEGENYSIQSLYSSEYIYGASSQSAYIPTTEDHEINQHFSGLTDGTWGIYSDLSTYGYHPAGHASGTGTSGYIVTWQTSYSTSNRNVWFLKEITDTELIDSLLAVRAVELLNEELQERIDSATAAVELAKTYPSEDNPQYSYIDGLAEIVDELESKAEEYTAVVEALEATQEQIDELSALLAQFYALAAETTEYEELLAEAEALVEGALVGEDPGYFPEEAITALEEAIAAAEDVLTDSPTAETVAAAIAALEEAIATFEAAMNQIETGKWYYLATSWTDDNETYGTEYGYAGSYLYACDDVVGDTLYNGSTFYRVPDDAATLNARYMWKFEEASDGEYYIINRAMGVGLYTVTSFSYNKLVSATYGSWNVTYEGNGYYSFSVVGSYTYYLAPYAYNRCANIPDYYFPDGDDYFDYPYWQVIPVEEDTDDEGAAFTIPVLNNNIKIETLPFSVGYWGDESDPVSVGEMNGEDVWATYAVQSITYDETDDITTVNLTRADYFDAGEPFVLVTGDPDMYEGYLTYGDTIDILFPVTDEFVIEGGKANGLAGNLVGGYCYIDSAGYIAHDDDYITYAFTSSDGTYIAFNSGYFLMNAEETDDEVDYQIFFEGGKITGVKSATQIAEEKAAVATGNVYDLQGRQVSEPGKGIYIVGGKKVIYK